MTFFYMDHLHEQTLFALTQNFGGCKFFIGLKLWMIRMKLWEDLMCLGSKKKKKKKERVNLSNSNEK